MCYTATAAKEQQSAIPFCPIRPIGHSPSIIPIRSAKSPEAVPKPVVLCPTLMKLKLKYPDSPCTGFTSSSCTGSSTPRRMPRVYGRSTRRCLGVKVSFRSGVGESLPQCVVEITNKDLLTCFHVLYCFWSLKLQTLESMPFQQ